MRDLQPMTVEQLLTKLRGMLGHVTRRNGETVTAAIEAIFELSKRLHEATTGIVDDGAKPVTAEQVSYLLDRAHADYDDRIAGAQSKMRLQERLLGARDAALANDREPQTVTLEWDELRALLELFGPTAVRGLRTHILTVEHPDTGALITTEFPSTDCGRRCQLHDECELACVLAAGHVDTGSEACRCQIAVRTLEQRHPGEETTAARQKGPTD